MVIRAREKKWKEDERNGMRDKGEDNHRDKELRKDGGIGKTPTVRMCVYLCVCTRMHVCTMNITINICLNAVEFRPYV